MKIENLRLHYTYIYFFNIEASNQLTSKLSTYFHEEILDYVFVQ